MNDVITKNIKTCQSYSPRIGIGALAILLFIIAINAVFHKLWIIVNKASIGKANLNLKKLNSVNFSNLYTFLVVNFIFN